MASFWWQGNKIVINILRLYQNNSFGSILTVEKYELGWCCKKQNVEYIEVTITQRNDVSKKNTCLYEDTSAQNNDLL